MRQTLGSAAGGTKPRIPLEGVAKPWNQRQRQQDPLPRHEQYTTTNTDKDQDSQQVAIYRQDNKRDQSWGEIQDKTRIEHATSDEDEQQLS